MKSLHVSAHDGVGCPILLVLFSFLLPVLSDEKTKGCLIVGWPDPGGELGPESRLGYMAMGRFPVPWTLCLPSLISLCFQCIVSGQAGGFRS